MRLIRGVGLFPAQKSLSDEQGVKVEGQDHPNIGTHQDIAEIMGGNQDPACSYQGGERQKRDGKTGIKKRKRSHQGPHGLRVPGGKGIHAEIKIKGLKTVGGVGQIISGSQAADHGLDDIEHQTGENNGKKDKQTFAQDSLPALPECGGLSEPLQQKADTRHRAGNNEPYIPLAKPGYASEEVLPSRRQFVMDQEQYRPVDGKHGQQTEQHYHDQAGPDPGHEESAMVLIQEKHTG